VPDGLFGWDPNLQCFCYFRGGTWTTIVAGKVDVLQDADMDTRVEVETTSDEDVINFFVKNTLRAKLTQTALEMYSGVHIGKNAGSLNSTNNVYIGDNSGSSDVSGILNTFVGESSGNEMVEGDLNSFFGSRSGRLASGNNNSFFGAIAGERSSGSSNAFFGNFSGRETSGAANSFFGSESGTANTEGRANVFMGAFSGKMNTIGGSNIFIGRQSGEFNTAGSNNTYVGDLSGFENINGSFNSIFGANAGSSVANGNYNIFMGARAARNLNSANMNIIIGNSPLSFGNMSNKLIIDSDTLRIFNPLIYGDFESDFLRIGGTLNINDAFEFPITDGTTGQVLGTDGFGNVDWQDSEAGSDDQVLSLSNNQLTIENGNTVDLSTLETGVLDIISNSAGTHSIRVFDTPNPNQSTPTTFRFPDGKKVSMSSNGFNFSDGTSNSNLLYGKNSSGGGALQQNNVRIGLNSLINLGSRNTVLGNNSGNGKAPFTALGNDNLILGQDAGNGLTQGSKNVFIGNSSGRNLEGSNNILLGYQSGTLFNDTIFDNRLIINSVGGNNPLIYGEFDNSFLRIGGTLNVNNAFEFPITDGTVGQVLLTDGAGNLDWQDNVGSDDQTLSIANTQLTIEGGNAVDLSIIQDGVNDADSDPANELQSLSVSVDSILISDGLGIKLTDIQDGVNDADADPNNEIQDIFLSGTNLSISSGHTLDLSILQDGVNDADADPNNELQSLSLTSDSIKISDGQGINISDLIGNTKLSLIQDMDMDTRILAEKNVDEDTLRFEISGYELMKMDGQTLHLEAPGESLFIGKDAGKSDDGLANQNLMIGHHSGEAMASGGANTLVGYETAKTADSGQANVYLGYQSGKFASGSTNTFLGFQSGAANGGSGNIFLGAGAGSAETGSNLLVIDNGSRFQQGSNFIKGDMQNNTLEFRSSIVPKGGIFDATYSSNYELRNDAHIFKFGNAVKLAITENQHFINTDANITGNTTVAGNVGVGINSIAGDSPSSSLHIIHDSSSGTTQGLRIDNSFGTVDDNWWNIHAQGASGDLLFYSGDTPSSGSVRFTIESGGKVGIGTSNPTEKLEVTGKVKANAFELGSDIRFKDHIDKITNTLQSIQKVNGYRYNFRTKEFPERGFDERRHIGVLAQEIETEFPELVSTDEQGFKSVDYSSMTAVLIEGMKEQQEMIVSLLSKVETLENEKKNSIKKEKAVEARLVKLENLLSNSSTAQN